jgi:ubiquinone/menaquinone biosynthesis C-methylase UbiE
LMIQNELVIFEVAMSHVFSADQYKKLDSPDRVKILPAREILLRTGLMQGQVMADVGAGTGFFSFPAASIVGKEGRVLATDISQDMLDLIRERMTDENRDIIRIIHPDLNGSDEFVNVVDYLLMCTVLHEVNDPLEMLKDSYRVIKPGGRCVIVEWIKVITDKGPPIGDRIDMAEVSSMLREAGFSSVEEIHFSEWFYIVIGVK